VDDGGLDGGVGGEGVGGGQAWVFTWGGGGGDVGGGGGGEEGRVGGRDHVRANVYRVLANAFSES